MKRSGGEFFPYRICGLKEKIILKCFHDYKSLHVSMLSNKYLTDEANLYTKAIKMLFK